MKDNIRWIDYARVLATFCVIVIHVSYPIIDNFAFSARIDWQVANILDGIGRFCVPMFFMIIGVIMLNRDYKLSDFLKKRVLRILPPFVFWTFIYLTYNFFIYEGKSFNLVELWTRFYKGLLYGIEYHLWFMFPLIGVYLFMPIARKWVNNATNNEVLYFLIIWLITILYRIPAFDGYLPIVSLLNFSGYMGYVVLGFYLDRLDIKKFQIPLAIYIIGAFITIYGSFHVSEMKNQFDGIFHDYMTVNILIESIGIFLVLKLIVIRNKILNKIITFLSIHSFGIYLVHILVLEWLKKAGLSCYFSVPVVGILLTSIACISVSSIIIFLIRKIKFGEVVSG